MSLKNELQKRSNSALAIASKNVTDADAIEFIKYYRKGLPVDSLTSIWIDKDFIDFIATNSIKGQISGVRVYFSKYKDKVGSVGSQNGPKPDELSIILAATTATRGDNIDIPGGYFDYGDPCPPTCNGGI